VDDPGTLRAVLGAILDVSRRLPVAFAVHPRTRARIEQHGLGSVLEAQSILCVPPLGYLGVLGLMQAARMVLTDSGGIQEETTALDVPCITLRENTERPITVEQGTNTVVGSSPAHILAAVDDILRTGGKAGRSRGTRNATARVNSGATSCNLRISTTDIPRSPTWHLSVILLFLKLCSPAEVYQPMQHQLARR